jgi:hypothetical protein
MPMKGQSNLLSGTPSSRSAELPKGRDFIRNYPYALRFQVTHNKYKNISVLFQISPRFLAGNTATPEPP